MEKAFMNNITLVLVGQKCMFAYNSCNDNIKITSSWNYAIWVNEKL